jgi:hypothetical protein
MSYKYMVGLSGYQFFKNLYEFIISSYFPDNGVTGFTTE